VRILLKANRPFTPEETTHKRVPYSTHDVPNYIDEVKYRMAKNDSIAALEQENIDLRQQVAQLKTDKEALTKEIGLLKSANRELHKGMTIARQQSAVIDNLDKETRELREEIDQLKKKAIGREERVVDLKSKRDALREKIGVYLKINREALSLLTESKSYMRERCNALYKEIEELKASRDYVSRLRHTVCPTKKYWLDEVNQKHSDKLKEVVRALGKKHVAKRERLTHEKDAFAKRVFELTEEIALKHVSESKSQVNSLKLQLAAEKIISKKYARDLQERQSVLTAM
jgi:predicted RNase H-like nuclease (RuvC/YqgF family)